MKYSYDPEADILAIKIANKPYDYAEELGDFIVHFNKNNKPVYIEILNANNFVKQTLNLIPKKTQKKVPQQFPTNFSTQI